MTSPDFANAVLLNQDDTNAPKDHPPGIVAALAGEAARYTRFAVCMQSLGYKVPPGSGVQWVLGSDISESRNQVFASALETQAQWVWFVDDDHSFRDDILLGLLDRAVDIVSPVCLRRSQPFLPVPAVNGNFMRLDDWEPEQLVEVDHTGTSGMLIRRNVIEAMTEPWFELGDREQPICTSCGYPRDQHGESGGCPEAPTGGPYSYTGPQQGNRVSEDVNFCRKAQQAGFKVHVDMRQRLAHLTTAAIWPVYSEEHERWLTGFTVADGAQLAIDPAVVETIAE